MKFNGHRKWKKKKYGRIERGKGTSSAEGSSERRGSRERTTLATGCDSEEEWDCHDLDTAKGHFISHTDLSAFPVSKLLLLLLPCSSSISSTPIPPPLSLSLSLLFFHSLSTLSALSAFMRLSPFAVRWCDRVRDKGGPDHTQTTRVTFRSDRFGGH